MPFRSLGQVAIVSLLTVLGFGSAWAEDPGARAAKALYEGLVIRTLPNGLQIYLKPIPGVPTVSTMLAYKVGSADEELNATGLSHYLEHLMFKGTNKLMPGDIDRMTMRSGGRNNANTSEDCTIYHFDFSAASWETALKIEAERMRNLVIDSAHEFEQEKGAVISELEMGEDGPFDLELKAILPILFGSESPYGHPVIGERQHVRQASAEMIKAHYDRWYHPNNAVLVMVGGFDPDRAMNVIEKLFGSIPAGKLPERKIAKPVAREKEIRKEIASKFEVPRMVMGFQGVRAGDPDDYVLDVIQELMSGGKTSRLYRRLVEKEELVSSINLSSQAGRYPGWIGVEMEVLQDKPRERAENVLREELERLAKEPVSSEELQRAIRSICASYIFQREDVHRLADSIARGVTVANLDYLKSYLPKIQAVTAGDIQRVARDRLRPEQSVVVWSIPQPKKGGAEGKTAPGKRQREPASTPTGAPALPFENFRRIQLPNGLTLLLLENHRLPIFTAEVYVKGNILAEPYHKAGVANLTGELLDEGTTSRTGEAIARAIEDVGGKLSLGLSGGSLQVLSNNQQLGLELLFDCLMNPVFPEESLARKRAQTLSTLTDAEQRADVQAARRFRETIYGKEHPLGRLPLGRKETVEKLTRDDCRAFHRERFVPNHTLVAIVGDFQTDELVASIEKLTANWKPGKLATEPASLPDAPPGTEAILTFPESAQLYVYVGQKGIRRNDPDYYKLLVMDYILGTGSGFTDRLSSTLRDRQGLAYSVSANITDSASEIPGLFIGSIATFPDKFLAVKEGFLKEIERIRMEPPTADEVADAKSYLIGSLPFKFSSNANVCQQLLLAERFGLGRTVLSDFVRKVSEVTPADVQAVAKKHLPPRDRIAIIAAGAVDREGKPLKPPSN